MKIGIIGSGFSSLAAACYLAKAGHQVSIYEKNKQIGGRARQFHFRGFTFDMGPSWYWMPDVFEKFFNDFDAKVSDFYRLEKLNPAYKVFFEDDQSITIGSQLDTIAQTFEGIEAGSAKKLYRFIEKAADNYRISMDQLVYRPGVSPTELISKDTITRLNRFYRTISNDVRAVFSNPKLIKILEFPVLFLGAKPSQTPSFYSFMNYADFGLGTWHPKGGMHQVIQAVQQLAISLGVVIHCDHNVDAIQIGSQARCNSIVIQGKSIAVDLVVCGADYAHGETLLPTSYRQYSASYWDSKTFAPSSLLFYIGFSKKLKNIAHHNLFFDTDFDAHANCIYDSPSWPEDPLFYANFTSVTDPDTAPEACENGFFLIPIATGIADTPELRNTYYDKIMNRLEQRTDQKVRDAVLFSKSYCITDFVKDYNAYKGNAYGMANTLRQTAFLRPKLKSKKVKNLYFTGQLTVPGPGVPPALISGKLVAGLIQKDFSG